MTGLAEWLTRRQVRTGYLLTMMLLVWAVASEWWWLRAVWFLASFVVFALTAWWGPLRRRSRT